MLRRGFVQKQTRVHRRILRGHQLGVGHDGVGHGARCGGQARVGDGQPQPLGRLDGVDDNGLLQQLRGIPGNGVGQERPSGQRLFPRGLRQLDGWGKHVVGVAIPSAGGGRQYRVQGCSVFFLGPRDEGPGRAIGHRQVVHEKSGQGYEVLSIQSAKQGRPFFDVAVHGRNRVTLAWCVGVLLDVCLRFQLFVRFRELGQCGMPGQAFDDARFGRRWFTAGSARCRVKTELPSDEGQRELGWRASGPIVAGAFQIATVHEPPGHQVVGPFLQSLGHGVVQGLRRNDAVEVFDAVVHVGVVGPCIVQNAGVD